MSEIDKYRDGKEDFIKDFEELRPDYFIPQLYEKDSDRELVANEVRPARTKSNMFFSIPMRCRGSKCPVANSCPLLKKNKAPVGQKCPIELAMISDLAHGLMKELNVDKDSFVEISMIRDLVNEEVQQIRASNILADEDFIQENFVGMTPDGEPIWCW